MLGISTSQLSAYTYPRAPSAQEILGPPPTLIEPIISQLSTDPATSAVLSILNDALGTTLKQISSQLSIVSTRIDHMESRFHQSQTEQPYSPSAPAALWQLNPSTTNPLPTEEQNSLPHYRMGQPNFDIDYDMAAMEQEAYQPPNFMDDDVVTPNVEDFFRCTYNVNPLQVTLSDSQKSDLFSFDHNVTTFISKVLGYQGAELPWPENLEHQFKLWRASMMQSRQLAIEHCNAKSANKKLPPPPPPAPITTGSIKLFPDRPPSAPPIVVINPPPNAPPPIPTHTRPSPGPWKVAKGPNQPQCNQGNKPTFAQAAQLAPRSTPIQVTPCAADLSDSQLKSLSCDQLICAIEVRFQVSVKHRSASKAAYIQLYTNNLTKEAATLTAPIPQASKLLRPRAQPVITLEFTITRRPDTTAVSQPKTDPATIVGDLQRAIRQHYNGANSPLSLLSGRWGSNLSHNFILTFAGRVDNAEILRIHKILIQPFGPGASIVPQ